MITSFDGKSTRRNGARAGDRAPLQGIQAPVVSRYVATGGETSVSLSALTTPLTYAPGLNQIKVYRGGYKGTSGSSFFELSSTSIGFPSSEPLLAGEELEFELAFQITGVVALPLSLSGYTATGVAGQTSITADFSWPYNLFPSKNLSAVDITIDGQSLTPKVDFTEVNLGLANTNQITLLAPAGPLVGGENIAIVPRYQFLDQTAAATSFNGQSILAMQSALGAGLQGFIDTSSLISVPNTSVVSRAKIVDPANDLRANMGNERIPVQSIYDLQNEFGPNGERVSKVINDDKDLIRFVGTWVNNSEAASGIGVGTSTAGDFVEVTFYGTGLNLLWRVNNSIPVNAAMVYSVDGGADTSIVFTTPGTLSELLANRNYAQNTITPVIAGLASGLHTVRIKRTQTSGSAFHLLGFEITNESSSVKVNPGTAYISGQKLQLLSQSVVAYNSAVTGTRGGRVLSYLSSAGVVTQAFQAVNASQGNLTSADHTNEEVARTYHYREFGANRTDDFSTLVSTQADRAFTLDDDTTTLLAQQVQNQNNSGFETIQTNNTGASFVVFTFVGTGLDLIAAGSSAGTNTSTITIDGISVGAYAPAVTLALKQHKIVSGLPYGTHVMKLIYSAGSSLNVKAFVVYQPKKPTLPAGAVELADYNVMATPVANSTNDVTAISTGVLRKQVVRELTFAGAGWSIGIDNSSTSGYRFINSTSGDYFEYTFFGTGFDMRGEARASATATASLQNLSAGGAMLTLTSTNFPGLTTSAYAYAFNYATGAITTATAATAGGVVVNGLTLGLYRVRIALTSANQSFFHALDIFTPIHSHKSNLYADYQNSLPIGSQGISDNRQTSIVKGQQTATKFRGTALGVVSSPTSTSSSFVPIPDMSLTVPSKGGWFRIIYSGTYMKSSQSGARIQIYVDGAVSGTVKEVTIPSTNGVLVIMDYQLVYLSPGVHTVVLYWGLDIGTITALTTERNLVVEET